MDSASQAATIESTKAVGAGAQPEVAARKQAIGASFETLKLLAETTAVSGSLAYIAGWSCLYSYYNAFGIGLLGLDIPFSVACVFALRVLLRSVWPGVTVTLVLLLYPIARRRLRRSLQRSVTVMALTLLVATVLGVSGASVGHKAAMADMLEETSELPLVSFVTAPHPYPVPDCLGANALECRLLVFANGLYYFFEPIRDANANRQATSLNVEVYTVAAKDVTLVRVQRGVK